MSRKHENNLAVQTLILATALLANPCGMLAQRGAGGGHVGGGAAGGGGLSGGGKATGLDEKDDLKSFHAALAMQATAQQIVDFNLMLKSTEAAAAELRALREEAAKQNNAPELASRDKSFGQALDTARTRNKKFLDGLSERQKSGLKELVKKLSKTDADLAQQAKALDDQFEGVRQPGLQIAGSAQGLEGTLTIFHSQQIELGEEMSVAGGNSDTAINLPPRSNTISFNDQAIAVTTNGVISKDGMGSAPNTFKLELTADVSDLQQNITAVLSGQLDKAETCGERISVQNADLTAWQPASVIVVRMHYERWACFGRSLSNEMAEGNATFEVKLTPEVANDGSLQLSAKIGRVNAEQFLGELLSSGSLGETLRDKIAGVVLSTVRLGADYKRALPPAAQADVTLHHAEFQGGNSGRLTIAVDGEMRLSDDAFTALSNASKVKTVNTETKAQSSTQSVTPQ